MPQLTRKEMEAVIASGGSVLHNGQTIWQVGQLPTEVDLAAGDPAQEAVAATTIQAQIAGLQAQLDKLGSVQSADAASNEPETDAPPSTGSKKSKAGTSTPDE